MLPPVATLPRSFHFPDKGPLQSYILDGLSIPRAVFSLAIEPEKSSQQTELDHALAILCMEDPR